MKIFTEINPLREALRAERKQGKTIGFVPTMGYFHQGHLALMHRAKETCDVVVVSIFVNPIQFAPSEDYQAYPRDLEKDKKIAETEGVDYLFIPSNEEMYPKGYCTFVNVERITEKLCGARRPGHFKGVATVVSKLFNIVQPDKAFFGEKDAQQLIVMRRMVENLNFDVEIIGVPTVRDEDGLAMSSRNVYLDAKERRAALVLSRSLKKAQEMIKSGERKPEVIKKTVEELLQGEPLVDVEYISICDIQKLEEVSELKGSILIVLAARVGKARLIDNVFLDLSKP